MRTEDDTQDEDSMDEGWNDYRCLDEEESAPYYYLLILYYFLFFIYNFGTLVRNWRPCILDFLHIRLRSIDSFIFYQ